MNREAHLKLADDAVTRAARLAGWAEEAARAGDPEKAEPCAAAGTLWDSIARTHLLRAQAIIPAEEGDDRG
ncbi:hypothetical protein [Streptomyces sp. NPDC058108]|uniref:hypothetical protein n=1 Tax=Streptomyces sp. NPDC058108 TaxID=3346344 RepID=UPI0036E5B883